MDDVLDAVTQIMRQVFEAPDLAVTRESSAQTIRGWDSLNHVALILGVESHFKLKFRASEIASLKNVGELTDLIARRKAALGR